MLSGETRRKRTRPLILGSQMIDLEVDAVGWRRTLR